MPPFPQPELVLIGGEVRTLDPRRPRASAIAIAGGRIVAVGDDAPTRELAGPATEIIDLAGAAVVPGLVDSHTHAIPGGLAPRGTTIERSRSRRTRPCLTPCA